MQHQRKRFSYLTVQQRALNTSNVIDTDKPATSRQGSILNSINKSHRKQQPTTIQPQYTSFSRTSSAKKAVQPLTELCQNPIFADIKTSATKLSAISNKQNLPLRHSLKNDQKPSYPKTSRPSSTNPNLQYRIKQLEQQNSLILKQTQDKFLLMEKHLEKVQGILKQKEQTIQSLVKQNMELKDKGRSMEEVNGKLVDQKEELLRIINEKNEEIKSLVEQKESMFLKQSQLLDQINTYTLQQSKPITLESTKPQQPPQSPINSTFSTQTTLTCSDINSLITKSNQLQSTDKLNYRQKYQALFKRALQMEDQMYKLKEELFDSQNEVKTIQQEFNTFKIFNQIQKINLQN